MTKQRADELELPLMVDDNTSSFEAALTISTKARSGVTIGISAADRARMLFWRKQIAEL